MSDSTASRSKIDKARTILVAAVVDHEKLVERYAISGSLDPDERVSQRQVAKSRTELFDKVYALVKAHRVEVASGALLWAMNQGGEPPCPETDEPRSSTPRV